MRTVRCAFSSCPHGTDQHLFCKNTLAGRGNGQFSLADDAVLASYKKHPDASTRFIPGWVAMALDLGTMVGWKRIVVTVGEKIGKDHLTYPKGAAAEITAMFTIGAADWFGIP